MFFSVNYHYFLRDLRVSVVKWPFFSRLIHANQNLHQLLHSYQR